MAPRGTIWGSICIVVTLSDIETIWTKFGQNREFSLRNSVSLTPGLTVKFIHYSRHSWQKWVLKRLFSQEIQNSFKLLFLCNFSFSHWVLKIPLRYLSILFTQRQGFESRNNSPFPLSKEIQFEKNCEIK